MSRALKPYSTVRSNNYEYKMTHNKERVTKNLPDGGMSNCIDKQQRFFLKHIDSISHDFSLDADMTPKQFQDNKQTQGTLPLIDQTPKGNFESGYRDIELDQDLSQTKTKGFYTQTRRSMSNTRNVTNYYQKNKVNQFIKEHNQLKEYIEKELQSKYNPAIRVNR